MKNGSDLFKKHKETEFPEGYAGEEIKGIDLVLLDSDASGCMDSFYGSSGTIKKPAPEKILILVKCRDDLQIIIPELSGKALEYFQNLEKIVSIVISEIENLLGIVLPVRQLEGISVNSNSWFRMGVRKFKGIVIRDNLNDK
jgi:hypothetical protein